MPAIISDHFVQTSQTSVTNVYELASFTTTKSGTTRTFEIWRGTDVNGQPTPEYLRGATDAVDFGSLPFYPLYRTDREAAAEISNKTVHVMMHLSWVDKGHGDNQARWRCWSSSAAASARSTSTSSSRSATGSSIPP